MECQNDDNLRRVVNRSGLSTPDGMPLVWLSRLHGFRTAARVYGPDLMLALCDRGQSAGYRHFFYGGAPGIAERLADRLKQRYPRLVVAGIHSPPFRPAGTLEGGRGGAPNNASKGLNCAAAGGLPSAAARAIRLAGRSDRAIGTRLVQHASGRWPADLVVPLAGEYGESEDRGRTTDNPRTEDG